MNEGPRASRVPAGSAELHGGLSGLREQSFQAHLCLPLQGGPRGPGPGHPVLGLSPEDSGKRRGGLHGEGERGVRGAGLDGD